MKKFTYLLLASSLIVTLNSCFEECVINDTGEVIITNETNSSLWFDVTVGNTTNENRLVEAGGTTTYLMTSGNVKIWASLTSNDDDFIVVSDETVTQCGTTYYYTPTKVCQIFNTTGVVIVNNTGISTYFDLEVESTWILEVYIPSNGSYTYNNVTPGTARTAVETDWGWVFSEEFTLTECVPFTFTWNPKKTQEATPGIKESLTPPQRVLKSK